MSKEHVSPNIPEQPVSQEQFQSLVSALETLAIAVAALPGGELLTGDPETGPAIYLKNTQEKGLTLRYKPKQEEPPPHQDMSLSEKKNDQSSITTAEKPLQEHKEQPRLNVQGRLGAEVFYKQTSKGLLARFPLAVPQKEQDKKVSWQQVVAFGKVAEKVQASDIKKGMAVEVIGYLHEVKQKAGAKAKPRQEIYAASIRPVNKPAAKNNPSEK